MVIFMDKFSRIPSHLKYLQIAAKNFEDKYLEAG